MTVGQNDEPVFETTPDGKRTLNRRTLIKGAAAAGAAAWAAPVIIDSMASPAAATQTCFYTKFNPGPACAATGGPCCTASTNPLNCNTSQISATQDATNMTVTLHGSCTFSAGGVVADYDGGDCVTIVPSGQTAIVPLNGGGPPVHGLSHVCIQFCCSS